MMKKTVVIIFVLLFFLCVNHDGYSQQSAGPMEPEPKQQEKPRPLPSESGSKEMEKDEMPSSTPSPVPGMEKVKEMEAGELAFAAGATSPDGQFLYIVFDRFLLQYDSKTLDLTKKFDLGIPTAPVTPSISVSKDSKYLYIISNGILFQINGTTFKVENAKKITP